MSTGHLDAVADVPADPTLPARSSAHHGREDGNEPAARMDRLVTAHAQDVLAYLRRRTTEPEDAADVLAQTLLTAWRRVDDLPVDDHAARLWLFVTARNTLANHHRTQRRHLRATDSLRAHLEAQARYTSRDSAADATRGAIDRLPEQLRELLVLVHWDGFSLVEAAELTGTNASTVRSRYATARQQLQRLLAQPEGSAAD